MPEIQRLLETALYVDDLERSREFYQAVLGLDPMMESERMVAFDAGAATVFLVFQRGSTSDPLDVEGGRIPPHGSRGPSHFAFAIAERELDAWRRHLSSLGIPLESEVRWPMGGTSLYFRDPDGHSVELVTPGIWPVY
ncbi:MAG TPA: VOC family protein [Longimicrobiales bacterium]|nr:VOC family protein [Longimicrobiales bacterium]